MGWPGGRGSTCGWRSRGRSGLHRAGRWATPTRGDPRDSATENRPPPRAPRSAAVRVKRWCKRPPSAAGDRRGSANPTRSKVEEGLGHPHPRAPYARTIEGGPPKDPRVDCRRRPVTVVVDGWPPNGEGNDPGNRTRPTGQPVRTRPVTCGNAEPWVRQSPNSPQDDSLSSSGDGSPRTESMAARVRSSESGHHRAHPSHQLDDPERSC